MDVAWSTEKTTSGNGASGFERSGTRQARMARIAGDGGGAPRTSRHGGDDVRCVGAAGLRVERAPLARVQPAQGRRAEHATGRPTAVDARRRDARLGHRADEVERPAAWTPVAVRRHRRPLTARTVR